MKKASIAIALVLVFGLFAAAFSLAPALAQNATSNTNATSTNATGTGNATSTNATTTGGSTFSARGSIASLIFDTGGTMTGNATTGTSTANATGTAGNMTTSDNATGVSGNVTMSQTITGNASSNATTTAPEVEPPYVLSGDWNLDVQDGNVSDFAATFTMVHTDGTGHHTHELSNFQASNTTTVQLDEAGLTFIFGTVDVAVNGTETWTDAGALIIIEKLNVVSLSLATEDTDDHFKGQPIYGITESFTDENGNELIQTTQTAGNATGGNMTQGAQGAANETGEFFGNVTEGVQDFSGTGQ